MVTGKRGLIVLVTLGMSFVTEAQQHNEWPIVRTARFEVEHLPFSWPQNKHEAERITKRRIVSLLAGIDKIGGEDPIDMRNDVESYTFETLDNDSLYLLATRDWGSTWFQYIDVVRCEKHMCHVTTIHSESEIDLNKQLLDLNKNGRHLILAEECICAARAHEGGILPYIFEVSNNEVRDASAKHPEFFQARLAPIPLDTPNDLNSQEMIDERHAELVFAQRDIERRVFGSRAAGLTDALQWEQSNSEDIKLLAIETFESIDGPKSEAGLKRLSQSDSSYIRQRAQEALARKPGKLAH